MTIFTRIAAALGRRPCNEPEISKPVGVSPEALAGEGRFAAAIDLASDLNRAVRNPELERQLVGWRRAAFKTLPPAVGRPDWPPVLPDPFPGLVGVPEIPRDQLSADVLGGAILHHGCLIVRGLLSEPEADQRRADIDRAFDGFDAFWDRARAGEPPSAWYNPFPEPIDDDMSNARQFVREGEGVWTAESPPVLFDVIEGFKAAGVQRAIAGFLGEAPVISLGKSTLRRVPTTTGTDWHQDGSFMGADIRTVNVWLALSHCGEDAPGLDIVARRLPGLVESGTPGAYFPWSVAPDRAVAAADGAPIVSPLFAPGDAVLFDHLCLHRTGVRPGMTKTRYAIESWFFAPSAYASKQVPLAF
jgi:hypothetical protein